MGQSKTRSNEESMQEMKRENRRLKDENAKLKDQLEEMRQKLGSGQDEMDPFTFDGAGEEVEQEEENPVIALETQQTRGQNKDKRRKETAVQRKESELQNAWVVLERMQEEDISTESVVTFSKGDAVEAYYFPEKTWYRANVLGKRKKPEGYRVRYAEDNFVEVVKPAHVRKIPA
ncbi:uncharacterized protein LOC134258029 [Saccostrea cucullata]|uniref:uncharacterized protein LOC134258029 n=1 Tax=Saccostrea cuccullata TaxID=36930 RepID=UPI002ED3EA62